MHPSIHAKKDPHKPAVVMAENCLVRTFAELDQRSNQIAHLLRSHGIERGDVVAIFMENSAAYFDALWGAQRAGVYYVPVSSRLKSDEVAYILRDSGAKLVIISVGLEPVMVDALSQLPELVLYIVDGDCGDVRSFESAYGRFDPTPITDESAGSPMLYSSGTTGFPKGIRPPLPDPALDRPSPMMGYARNVFGMDYDTIYLCPSPLYHAAPMRWCMTVQAMGGTVIVMEKFDPAEALRLIESYRVTHAQFVPTHFVRMLRLPDQTREATDLSSVKAIFHAAAPCPVVVKQQMLDWWGDIIYEYYAGSEGNGITIATPQDWLAHPGTVGKAVNCEVKICDESGETLPLGEIGNVFFAGGAKFQYHNDPEKTRDATNQYGWTTLGDIGYLDDDGFLYLTDRKSFTIISGGVNVYPQEIENLLVMHPEVADAAVVGAPDEEMGEIVTAIIQPLEWADAGRPLAERISSYLRERLSGVKLPRRIDFIDEMPREPTGKLFKKGLRAAYLGERPELRERLVSGL